jgi:hypothetical protein
MQSKPEYQEDLDEYYEDGNVRNLRMALKDS